MKKFLIPFFCIALTLTAVFSLVGCGHSHVFDQKVEANEYLDKVATATTNASYFHSCICGEKGTTTFEVEKKELNIDVSASVLAGHNITYCRKLVSQITAEDLGLEEGSVVKTYYKVRGASDETYSTNRVYEAGLYTCKIEIEESIENKALIKTFDFEIKPIVVTLNPNITSVAYTGSTSALIAPSHFYYPDILSGDGNITLIATFSQKDVGVYSVEDGTLQIESYYDNPNYVFVGSIKVKPQAINNVNKKIKITLEEGKTLYTVDLAEQGIVLEGDDVKAGIYVSKEITEAGTYKLYWKFPVGAGVTLPAPQYAISGEGLMGKDAKNYEITKKTSTGENIYYLEVEISLPTT